MEHTLNVFLVAMQVLYMTLGIVYYASQLVRMYLASKGKS